MNKIFINPSSKPLILMVLLFIAKGLLADSPRLYLIENFTSTYSDKSAEANALLVPYLQKNADLFIPVFYHTEYANGQDPLYQLFPEISKVRGKYYQTLTDFKEIPKVYINGTENNGNSLNVRRLEERYRDIKQEMSPIDFSFEMSMDDSIYTMKVNVKSSKNLGKKKIHFYLMDYYYSRYELPANSIPNGELHLYQIPRKAFTGTAGQDINLKKAQDTTLTFEHKIDYTYKNGNSYLIAFIQDEETGEVIQAGTNFNIYPCEIKTDQPIYNLVSKGRTDKFEITFTNPTGYDIEYDLTAMAEDPNWETEFEKQSIYLYAGDSETVNLTIKANDDCTYSPITISAYPRMYYMKYYFGVKAKSSIKFHYLTKETDMLTLTFGDIALNKINRIQSEINGYQSRWAAMDYEVYEEGFSDKEFDFLYLALPSSYSDLWGTNSTLEVLANEYIQDEKNVLLTIPEGLYRHRFGEGETAPTESLKFLYTQLLKIEYSHTYESFAETGEGLDDFEIKENATIGYSANPYGKSIPFTQINTDKNLYFENLETIEINDESTEKLVIYCDNPKDTEGLTAGIYSEYRGGKCVYLTYGLESAANTDSARVQLEGILAKMGYAKKESLFEISNSELIFFTYIDSIETQTFHIKNKGNHPFLLSEMKLEGAGAEAFDYTPKLSNKTINGGEDIDITITFYPYAEMYYEATITFVTDSDTKPIKKVYIYGYGEKVSVVDEIENEMELVPNPVHTSATLRFVISKAAFLDIDLIDYSGRKVMDIFKGYTPVGENEISIDAENLPAGKYFIRFYDNKKSMSKALVIE